MANFAREKQIAARGEITSTAHLAAAGSDASAIVSFALLQSRNSDLLSRPQESYIPSAVAIASQAAWASSRSHSAGKEKTLLQPKERIAKSASKIKCKQNIDTAFAEASKADGKVKEKVQVSNKSNDRRSLDGRWPKCEDRERGGGNIRSSDKSIPDAQVAGGVRPKTPAEVRALRDAERAAMRQAIEQRRLDMRAKASCDRVDPPIELMGEEDAPEDGGGGHGSAFLQDDFDKEAELVAADAHVAIPPEGDVEGGAEGVATEEEEGEEQDYMGENKLRGLSANDKGGWLINSDKLESHCASRDRMVPPPTVTTAEPDLIGMTSHKQRQARPVQFSLSSVTGSDCWDCDEAVLKGGPIIRISWLDDTQTRPSSLPPAYAIESDGLSTDEPVDHNTSPLPVWCSSHSVDPSNPSPLMKAARPSRFLKRAAQICAQEKKEFEEFQKEDEEYETVETPNKFSRVNSRLSQARTVQSIRTGSHDKDVSAFVSPPVEGAELPGEFDSLLYSDADVEESGYSILVDQMQSILSQGRSIAVDRFNRTRSAVDGGVDDTIVTSDGRSCSCANRVASAGEAEEKDGLTARPDLTASGGAWMISGGETDMKDDVENDDSDENDDVDDSDDDDFFYEEDERDWQQRELVAHDAQLDEFCGASDLNMHTGGDWGSSGLYSPTQASRTANTHIATTWEEILQDDSSLGFELTASTAHTLNIASQPHDPKNHIVTASHKGDNHGENLQNHCDDQCEEEGEDLDGFLTALSGDIDPLTMTGVLDYVYTKKHDAATVHVDCSADYDCTDTRADDRIVVDADADTSNDGGSLDSNNSGDAHEDESQGDISQLKSHLEQQLGKLVFNEAVSFLASIDSLLDGEVGEYPSDEDFLLEGIEGIVGVDGLIYLDDLLSYVILTN